MTSEPCDPSWIAVTPSLRQGLEIAQRVDSGKFRLLVDRICQSLRAGSVDGVFDADEREKLLASLDLKRDDLTLLLRTLLSIFRRAAYGIVQPAVMEATVKSWQLDESKTATFCHAWSLHAKGIVDAFKQKSIFPAQVRDIHWSLNVRSSSSTAAFAKGTRPMSLLQLQLTGEADSSLTVEMDPEDLLRLYDTLENIQRRLDDLK